MYEVLKNGVSLECMSESEFAELEDFKNNAIKAEFYSF
ncbi:hypothetical protein MgSA37_02158 [Mucilaginibacter gotjawali]|uniref:Uncharacterized protein n=2 Tax=Mucilaginibacter gotjawali TaxID=1550579 RepID=A0A839S7U7_9SPHI|nr:hypothetical protein [Mucilaginibacter gotjawali]BAU53987.1 hypothetical protein MgSA37_02158 [Mucilaginibacter gotjawali]